MIVSKEYPDIEAGSLRELHFKCVEPGFKPYLQVSV